MSRFVIDAGVGLYLVAEGIEVNSRHELLAPTLFRSQTLSLAHEARVRLFASHGWTEMDVTGRGIIMVDAAVVQCQIKTVLTSARVLEKDFQSAEGQQHVVLLGRDVHRDELLEPPEWDPHAGPANWDRNLRSFS